MGTRRVGLIRGNCEAYWGLLGAMRFRQGAKAHVEHWEAGCRLPTLF